MKKISYLALVSFVLVIWSCQKDDPDANPGNRTEWISRADGFEDRYTLDQMVILSRHNIRTPTVSKQSVLTRLTNSAYQWFPWEGGPSTLTPKGARLEMEMGRFFRTWLQKKGLLDKYAEDNGAFRFYANAKQRCQVTAAHFASTLLPDDEVDIEMHVEFDKMDPVFNPQITKLPEGYETRALNEIQQRFGDLDGGAAQAFALLEKVIDIQHAPAYPDTSSFSEFPSQVSFPLNAEPAMSGGLKMACTLSDALTLQYYEEPDIKKAAFGHTLSFSDWVTVTSITQRYEDILFTAPSVCVNVAHPLLQEMLNEMRNEDRVFCFLCGHDSNILSVLTALDAEVADLPGTIEKRTPIGCKLVVETFRGTDGNDYADLVLVYASARQLRAESAFSYRNPPQGVKIKLNRLKANADGLYTRADLEQRFTEAIAAYDAL